MKILFQALREEGKKGRREALLRRVYRYIPSQKWDSESILYTSWWEKNLKKVNHPDGDENIDLAY